MIIFGAIAAMLGMVAIFMLAAGLFFMWRMAQGMHEVAYQTGEVAKCLREELDEMKSPKPQFMMLPRGVLPEALKKEEALKGYDGGGNYR